MPSHDCDTVPEAARAPSEHACPGRMVQLLCWRLRCPPLWPDSELVQGLRLHLGQSQTEVMDLHKEIRGMDLILCNYLRLAQLPVAQLLLPPLSLKFRHQADPRSDLKVAAQVQASPDCLQCVQLPQAQLELPDPYCRAIVCANLTPSRGPRNSWIELISHRLLRLLRTAGYTLLNETKGVEFDSGFATLASCTFQCFELNYRMQC